jgi:hypothetical protein
MPKFILFCFCIFTLSGLAQNNRPIGINLAGVTDWSTELVFTDAFRQSRWWISSNADGSGPWDTQITIPLNAQGYPLEIPYSDGINPPQVVRALMLWDIGEAEPIGQYRLKVEGSGEVRLQFGASGTYSCPVDTLVNVTGPVSLQITQSNANDPIHNIDFVYPNYINTYQNQTFTNELLDFVADFETIRFMDWLNTNGSQVEEWSDRTPVDYYSQTMSSGVAWEYVIELANLTQKNIWINIPHKASDAYIANLAQMLHTQLHPNAKIYLEYSNEVWNSIFSQNSDCAAMAADLGYSGQAWERAWKYTAKRSADVFHVFETEFGGGERLVKVIPTQAANSWIAGQLVGFMNDSLYNPYQVQADAIAIAPYFAGNVANDIAAQNAQDTITVETILGLMQAEIQTSATWMADNQAVADLHGLDLICYEGGQHLVATGNYQNDTTLTAKLIAANHHPDLQAIYCEYLDTWYNNHPSLFCQFSSHGNPSKYGSWGVKITYQDTLNPKYLALQECVFNENLGVSTSEIKAKNQVWAYPNPSAESLSLQGFNNQQAVSVYSSMGHFMFTAQGPHLHVQSLSPGLYFVRQGQLSLKFIKN